MLENCEKQMIDLGHINDYYTFFEQVTQNCKKRNIQISPGIGHLTLTEWHNLKTSIFNKMT